MSAAVTFCTAAIWRSAAVGSPSTMTLLAIRLALPSAVSRCLSAEVSNSFFASVSSAAETGVSRRRATSFFSAASPSATGLPLAIIAYSTRLPVDCLVSRKVEADWASWSRYTRSSYSRELSPAERIAFSTISAGVSALRSGGTW
ncbi:hypothetical protein SPZE110945_14860 [Sphingomonas zeae]